MKKTSTDSQNYSDRIRSWATSKAHGPSPLSGSRQPSPVVLENISPTSSQNGSNADANISNGRSALPGQTLKSSPDGVVDNTSGRVPSSTTSPEVEGPGTLIGDQQDKPKKNVAHRFYHTTKGIIFSSYINILLVFVPVGIAAKAANLNATIIFAMNAIAIIPLAGLLSHATESVAKRMGDTIGALMNVTFGNAVELIIFMYVYLTGARQERARSPLKGIIISIASQTISSDLLTSHMTQCDLNELRIVQASLLGSILANLLLILGMCFLVGGLRFREQIYNSTVTQMSACLLSLSVMSLLLPTAFHASYSDQNQVDADTAVLKVSRGTSVILLLVYGLYLLFQLKSHAYMYESTPQHIIDEQSAPGPVAAWMDSSSSSDDSSSSSDSDDSSRSNTTARRIKRVMRAGRRRRKSSAGSKEHLEISKLSRKSPFASGATSPVIEAGDSSTSNAHAQTQRSRASEMGDEDDDEGQTAHHSRTTSFNDKLDRKQLKKELKRQKAEQKRRKRRNKERKVDTIAEDLPGPAVNEKHADSFNEPRRVDFAVSDLEAQTLQKKPFTLGGLNLRPAMPKTFSQGIFGAGSPQPGSPDVTGPIPRVRYGIRRTNSLPDRLDQQPATSAAGVPALISTPRVMSELEKVDDDDENISRTTAVFLLLVSTGLVAVCAEFMVDSISDVTQNTSLGETFVGLIILPIVGNAAEHVTAVTVAAKNKMDLAIGVAVGSSIQIALFVTPFVVLLGWAMGKEMTLYFTLFETVCLFVSAFIVNFLVLDGRSNYLEGALLCAAYVIIGVAAFFYPSADQQSIIGGGD